MSEPEQETLVAEYYDTDDLRLLRAGITILRRRGGADEGWHLKLPDDAEGTAGPRAGGSHRREIRLGLRQGDRDRAARRSEGGDPVPAEFARLVRAHVRGRSLGPVARIETRRRLTILRDAAGTSLAEIAEDEVAAQSLGASTTLSRWSELEIELTGGHPRLLRAAAKRLRRRGLRPAGRSAKLERALAVDARAARSRRSGTPAGAGRQADGRPQAGQVIVAYIDEQAARLKALDTAVRREEPDAVHQMRVTTRRLRAGLQAFPLVLPEPATRRLRDELRWLGHVLGDARDLEVLDQHFQTALDRLPTELVIGPAKARVTAHFAPGQAAARDAVLAALDSERYFGILDELDRLLDDPPRTAAAAQPAERVLPQAVGHAYRRTKRRVRRAKRAPAGAARDVALHEARKAAKRARYAADAAEPALGRQARQFAKRMKAVQSVLGDHQDAVTARAVAREIGMRAHLAGENAFTFGLLNERAHRDALEYQRQARSVWKRAARRKARRWLSGPG